MILLSPLFAQKGGGDSGGGGEVCWEKKGQRNLQTPFFSITSSITVVFCYGTYTCIHIHTHVHRHTHLYGVFPSSKVASNPGRAETIDWSLNSLASLLLRNGPFTPINPHCTRHRQRPHLILLTAAPYTVNTQIHTDTHTHSAPTHY